jgi:hypothetical protein
LSAALLSPTDEILHCFAHSELDHRHHDHEALDLRHLCHFSYLCFRHRHDIDYVRLEALRNDSRFGPVFGSYLYLARKFFFVELPVEIGRDDDAEQHHQKIVRSFDGWRRRKKQVSILIKEVRRTLSAKNLRYVYPECKEAIPVLRFRHLLVLLTRYAHGMAWRRKLKSLLPF